MRETKKAVFENLNALERLMGEYLNTLDNETPVFASKKRTYTHREMEGEVLLEFVMYLWIKSKRKQKFADAIKNSWDMSDEDKGHWLGILKDAQL